MSKTYYTNGVQHTPLPRGPLGVGCRDVCVEGRDAVLMRLFYPIQQDTKQDTEGWTRWHLGHDYSVGLARFVVSTIKFGAWLVRCLAPLHHLYNDWLSENVYIPAKWRGGGLAGPGQNSKKDQQYSSEDQPKSSEDQHKTSDTKATVGEKMSVVVVSHGMASHRSAFSALATDLASHGLVVAMIEHRDGSACSSFHVDSSGYHASLEYTGFHPAQLGRRVEEVLNAITALKALDAGKLRDELDPGHETVEFAGRLDMSRLALVGHSYGGATVLKALAEHGDWFRAGIALDPWMFPVKNDPGALGQAITTPLLAISTEAFNTGVNLAAYRKLRSGHQEVKSTFYTMRGTMHHHGSDAPWMLGVVGWWAIGGTYTHQPHVIHQLQANLTLAFIHDNLDLHHCRVLSPLMPEYHRFIAQHQHVLIVD